MLGRHTEALRAMKSRGTITTFERPYLFEAGKVKVCPHFGGGKVVEPFNKVFVDI